MAPHGFRHATRERLCRLCIASTSCWCGLSWLFTSQQPGKPLVVPPPAFIRRRLAAAAAVVGQGLGHGGRKDEAAVVRIDDAAERRRLARQAHQFLVAHRRSAALPGAAAFLDEPKAHHVLEEPDRATETDLV